MSYSDDQLRELILSMIPNDGSTIGNAKLHSLLAEAIGSVVAEPDYWRVRDALLADGVLGKGRGRGGSVFLNGQPHVAVLDSEASGNLNELSDEAGLVLEMQEMPPELPLNGPTKPARSAPRQKKSDQAQVLFYRFDEKRKNNPHVGMVDTASDGLEETTEWAYDPHLNPELYFDSSSTRAQVETLIDDALGSDDQARMKAALEELKRLQSPTFSGLARLSAPASRSIPSPCTSTSESIRRPFSAKSRSA